MQQNVCSNKGINHLQCLNVCFFMSSCYRIILPCDPTVDDQLFHICMLSISVSMGGGGSPGPTGAAGYTNDLSAVWAETDTSVSVCVLMQIRLLFPNLSNKVTATEPVVKLHQICIKGRWRDDVILSLLTPRATSSGPPGTAQHYLIGQ